MKKIVIAFSFLTIAPTIYSEKNLLQQEVVLAELLEEKLLQERLHMIKFLEENEKNALDGIKKHFNFDDQEWSTVMSTIDKEVAFNQESMRTKWDYVPSTHDPSLPEAWINALQHECARHGIPTENLTFDTIAADASDFANVSTNRPRLSPDGSTPIQYVIAAVNLRLGAAQESPDRLNCAAAHELVHIVKNHGIYRQIIWDAIDKKNLKIDIEHPAYKNLFAAQEKTADTLVACTDAQYAHDYVDLLNKDLLAGVYPDNHKDVKVLHANWQLSQALANFQQAKSPIT